MYHFSAGFFKGGDVRHRRLPRYGTILREVSMAQVELTDGFVTLRRYRRDDAAALHEAIVASLPELTPWLPFAHEMYVIKETKGWLKTQPKHWKDSTEFNFAMIDPADGAMIGGCGLNSIDKDNRRANLGYWVRTDHSGKGVCPAAARLLARWGFQHLKLGRIEILVAVDNTRSRRAAQKAGAREEGVLRNRLWLHNRYHDAMMHSLIPGEV
jgi:ribosomal-protein-serine acetyltransferase